MSDGIQLAVFDCDGTIVDSQHSIVAAMHAAFEEYSLDLPSTEEVRRIIGLPLLEAISLLFPKGGADTHQKLREGYRAAYSSARERGQIHEPLFPGLNDAIDLLESTGWILGVATGKSHAGLVSTLQSHSLLERFFTLQTSDKAAGKPSPDMLLKAMSETGAEPRNTVMIGDTSFDMQMAQNAGTLAIGVAWGYHDVDELIAAGAAAIVHTCAEVPNAVSQLLEER